MSNFKFITFVIWIYARTLLLLYKGALDTGAKVVV